MLHTQGSTIHQHDTQMLDDEIRLEWAQNHNLPQRYNHLFQGTLEDRLQCPVHQRRRWITNVWAAQEAHYLSRDN